MIKRSEILNGLGTLVIGAGLAAILAFEDSPIYKRVENVAYVGFFLSATIYQQGEEQRIKELNEHYQNKK
jgi:hypothetical protein